MRLARAPALVLTFVAIILLVQVPRVMGQTSNQTPSVGVPPGETVDIPPGQTVVFSRPSMRAMGAFYTVPVTNQSSEAARGVDDGQVLTLTVLAGLTIQAEVTYQGPDARVVPCPTEPGMPNIARCTIQEERATTVAVRFTTTGAAPATEDIRLPTGCNNVALTWPNQTPMTLVAQAVSPSTALVAIWRLIPSEGRFSGWSPVPTAPNDLIRANRLDAVFICVSEPATLTRPVP
jgi:hypothetical protein